MDEFGLIRHFFRQSPAAGPGVLLGPGDDGAVLRPTPGCDLVMSLDTLLEGRHFPPDLPPEDLGWRSLATNLSDLAAMGAIPRWGLLSLSLPQVDMDWLAAFCAGFRALAEPAGLVLVGGDTVRGPLAVSWQVTGEVPRGQALLRSAGRPGQRLWLGGAAGEAALGLRQWQQGRREGGAVARFCRPEPQLALGAWLRGRGGACIDVSDGLLSDLGHLLAESGCGATLELARLPRSPLFRHLPEEEGWTLALAGGDDYRLLFSLPPTVTPPEGTCIGQLEASPGLRVLRPDGRLLDPLPAGWNHFGTP